MTVDPATLVRQLLEGYYGKGEYGYIFDRPIDDKPVDRIWNTPGNPEALEKLAHNKNTPSKARFAAIEILMQRDPSFFYRADRNDLINLYAEALAGDYTRFANYSWGDLYNFVNGFNFDPKSNYAGVIGERFLTFGKPAIPRLMKLLDNKTVPAVQYIGSEEVTMRVLYNFRVKDYAAYYLSLIADIPIKFPLGYLGEYRDPEIERLRAELCTKYPTLPGC